MAKRPQYTILIPVKQTVDKTKVSYKSAGVGWDRVNDRGSFISLKLDLIPLESGWDGSMLLMPNEDVPDDGEIPF